MGSDAPAAEHAECIWHWFSQLSSQQWRCDRERYLVLTED